MQYHRAYIPFSRGHASYPVFTAEEPEEEPIADRMNAFYAALVEAAKTAADTAKGQYTAEYTLLCQADIWQITYTLRLKERGRIRSTKTLIHHWQGGYLLPPGKSKNKKQRKSKGSAT